MAKEDEARRKAVQAMRVALAEYTAEISRRHNLARGLYWTLGTLVQLCPCAVNVQKGGAHCSDCRRAVDIAQRFEAASRQLSLSVAPLERMPAPDADLEPSPASAY